ncbi:MAG TPA: HEAT repeat domain-containing protein [Candidatus Binatia bacterium]|nr:HEAT repeat domain-containing protein [Candidatus Binatia bacterium]
MTVPTSSSGRPPGDGTPRRTRTAPDATRGARWRERLDDPSPVEREAALAEIAALDDAALADAVDVALAEAIVRVLASETRSDQRRAADAIAPLAARTPVVAAALARALAAPSPRLRWGAAFTLGCALAEPSPDLWPAAREAMALADGDQRWAAVELAARVARAHPAVAREVVAALQDPSPTLRKMVLYCLREVAPAGLAAEARRALDDPDAGVRLAALAAISLSPGDDRERTASATAVADRVARDPDPGVRRASAVALGKLGDRSPAVVAALDAATAGPDASLARAARDALARLRGPASGPR